jgi:aspartate aminotransferase
VPASPIRKLVPLADAAKARGVEVLHLNIGQPDLETPLPMRNRLKTSGETVYAYSPSTGTPEYLGLLRDYYARMDLPLEVSNLVATTGGSEAILFSMLACAGEGDEAIVVEPFYTNYASFAVMTGLRLVPVTSRGEDGFHLPPLDAWEDARTERTRLVILCNPNNPTGTVYSREELLMVADFCRRHSLFLVVDEVYREFVYDNRRCTSALSLAGFEETVIVVDSLSKRYSACGIRLGCLVTRNKEVYDACVRMAQGRLSPPGLAQLVALGAAELGPEYARSVVAEYQSRRDLLFEGLGAIPGVFLRKPEGAFYFVARLPISSSEDFARWLLSDFESSGSTVMLAPAPGFYATEGMGGNEVRIAYVLGCDRLARAVALLREALSRYQGTSERHPPLEQARPASR